MRAGPTLPAIPAVARAARSEAAAAAGSSSARRGPGLPCPAPAPRSGTPASEPPHRAGDAGRGRPARGQGLPRREARPRSRAGGCTHLQRPRPPRAAPRQDTRTPLSVAAAPGSPPPASWPRYDASPPTPGYDWSSSGRGGPTTLTDRCRRRALRLGRGVGAPGPSVRGVPQFSPCGLSSGCSRDPSPVAFGHQSFPREHLFPGFRPVSESERAGAAPPGAACALGPEWMSLPGPEKPECPARARTAGPGIAPSFKLVHLIHSPLKQPVPFTAPVHDVGLLAKKRLNPFFPQFWVILFGTFF